MTSPRAYHGGGLDTVVDRRQRARARWQAADRRRHGSRRATVRRASSARPRRRSISPASSQARTCPGARPARLGEQRERAVDTSGLHHHLGERDRGLRVGVVERGGRKLSAALFMATLGSTRPRSTMSAPSSPNGTRPASRPGAARRPRAASRARRADGVVCRACTARAPARRSASAPRRGPAR